MRCVDSDPTTLQTTTKVTMRVVTKPRVLHTRRVISGVIGVVWTCGGGGRQGCWRRVTMSFCNERRQSCKVWCCHHWWLTSVGKTMRWKRVVNVFGLWLHRVMVSQGKCRGGKREAREGGRGCGRREGEAFGGYGGFGYKILVILYNIYGYG